MAVMATPSLRFPLPAGGTERARGLVPLAQRGTPTRYARFPSRSGGNLQEGGKRLKYPLQRLFQVRNQVVGMLDAN